VYVACNNNLALIIAYDNGANVFDVDIKAIEVDDVHGFVYWSADGYIKQATLNGSNINVIISDTGKSINLCYIFLQQFAQCIYFVCTCTVVISQNNVMLLCI